MVRKFEEIDNKHSSSKRLGLFRAGVELLAVRLAVHNGYSDHFAMRFPLAFLQRSEEEKRTVDKSGFLKTYSAADKMMWKQVRAPWALQRLGSWHCGLFGAAGRDARLVQQVRIA